VLWPVFPLTFLAAMAGAGWNIRLHRMLGDRLGIESLGYAHTIAAPTATVLAALFAGLLGDRRPARPVMLLALVVLAAACLGVLAPWSGVASAAAIQSAGYFGSAVTTTIVTAYMVRGVTVRGVYIAVMLLEITRNVGTGLGTYGGVVVEPMTLVLGASAALALLAAPFLFWLCPPEQANVSPEVEDPLDRSPLSRGAGTGVVLLLGAYAALATTVSLLGMRAMSRSGLAFPSGSEYYEQLPRLPALLGLVLPFLAYAKRWRPRPMVATGMIVAAAGGLVVAASALLEPLGGYHVALGGRAGLTLGHDVVFWLGVLALLRQRFPVERMAFWYSAFTLARWLLNVGTMYLTGLNWSVTALVASLAILLVVVGLMAALRRSPTPTPTPE
jgi:hypothetical protein